MPVFFAALISCCPEFLRSLAPFSLLFQPRGAFAGAFYVTSSAWYLHAAAALLQHITTPLVARSSSHPKAPVPQLLSIHNSCRYRKPQLAQPAGPPGDSAGCACELGGLCRDRSCVAGRTNSSACPSVLNFARMMRLCRFTFEKQSFLTMTRTHLHTVLSCQPGVCAQSLLLYSFSQDRRSACEFFAYFAQISLPAGDRLGHDPNALKRIGCASHFDTLTSDNRADLGFLVCPMEPSRLRAGFKSVATLFSRPE